VFSVNIKDKVRRQCYETRFLPQRDPEKKWSYLDKYLVENDQNSDLGSYKIKILFGYVKFKIYEKCKIRLKTKNDKISSFWVGNFRFFQKKITQNGLRGGAEFGTHVWKNFELSLLF
jgi:hypothetical protein